MWGHSQALETRNAAEFGWDFPFKLVGREITAKGMPKMIMQRDAGQQHIQVFETLELAELSRDVSNHRWVFTQVAVANKPWDSSNDERMRRDAHSILRPTRLPSSFGSFPSIALPNRSLHHNTVHAYWASRTDRGGYIYSI